MNNIKKKTNKKKQTNKFANVQMIQLMKEQTNERINKETNKQTKNKEGSQQKPPLKNRFLYKIQLRKSLF